jgi:hypothetical protein
VICTVACGSSKLQHQSKQSPDQADVHIATALKDFGKQWDNSAMRRHTGRGQMPLLDPAGPAVRAAMIPRILADKLSPLATSVPLAVAAVPSIFAVAAGADISFWEKDGLASIRLSVRGTRVVAVAPLNLIKGKLDINVAVISDICSFLLHATPDQVRTLIPGVFRGTIGEGDLLYVPAGYVVAESIPKGGATDAMT